VARKIAVNQERVYRAAIVTGRTTRYEGAYNKQGVATGRVSFWRKYLGGKGFVDGWVEESDPITWHRLGEEQLAPPEPTVNDRGFLAYGGGPIQTDYGHQVHVYESSCARGPHTWLSMEEENQVNASGEEIAATPHVCITMDDSPQLQGSTAHLSLVQAIQLRAALDQFIQGVRTRWEGGQEMFDRAHDLAFAPVPEEQPAAKG
jgi:hypothetical protein